MHIQKFGSQNRAMKTKQENRKAEPKGDRHQHLWRQFWKDEGGSEMWKRQEGVPSGSQARKEHGGRIGQ